jgi:hypothetical protein
MLEVKMKCDHIYAYAGAVEVSKDNYYQHKDSYDFTYFTYCPFCRVQLHTLDGIPLGLPKDEDDCIQGGCED